ncbi:hypothetical protein QFZ88_001766 [Mesorhizobium sp. YL-MeA3-2017]|uniref:hypothetical protein n=1 Tax=unclassified Mesorhizobium TaxID=325217 RepID=UPI001111C8EE|nr:MULTISPECIES: hypothetical protein [unclassified Mesorhizobium]MBN9237238.1 hypothetical protein [Mesorhizobium sp.]MDQ0329439.1 hypothetical protein [Mesorhizobium sp. YL-MeA3-2017]
MQQFDKESIVSVDAVVNIMKIDCRRCGAPAATVPARNPRRVFGFQLGRTIMAAGHETGMASGAGEELLASISKAKS